MSLSQSLETQGLNQYLTFSVNNSIMGLDVIKLEGVIDFESVRVNFSTLVPNSIIGFMNFNGHALPVIDLQYCLTHKKTQVTSSSNILVLQLMCGRKLHIVGVVVNSVGGVVDIYDHEISERDVDSEALERHGVEDFFHGVSCIDESVVSLLNIDNVITEDEMNMLIEIGELAQNELDKRKEMH
jgi:chemotaxis signal transduction protein